MSKAIRLECKRLIVKRASIAGLVGVITALPADIPGIGTIVSQVVGSAIDLVALHRIMRSLVFEIGELFNYPRSEKEIELEVAAILAALAGAKAIEGVSSKYIAKGLIVILGKRVGKRSLSRIIPVIGMIVNASILYGLVSLVGWTAYRFYSKREEENARNCTLTAATSGDSNTSRPQIHRLRTQTEG